MKYPDSLMQLTVYCNFALQQSLLRLRTVIIRIKMAVSWDLRMQTIKLCIEYMLINHHMSMHVHNI